MMTELEEAVLKLNESEKKRLLRRLIANLDEGQDEDVKRAWLEEAQRRYQELKNGEVHTVSAREVIEKARDRLGNAR